MTPNEEEEKNCDSDELRKGWLGEDNFGWIPKGMGSFTATDQLTDYNVHSVI